MVPIEQISKLFGKFTTSQDEVLYISDKPSEITRGMARLIKEILD